MIVPNGKPALAWTVALSTCTCLHADTFTDGFVNELSQGHIAPFESGDANVRNRCGNALLMHAAVYASQDLLTFVSHQGADVNAANPAGDTALMRAVPDSVKVRLFVEHGAPANFATVAAPRRCCSRPVSNSASPLITYFVKNGADLRAVAVTFGTRKRTSFYKVPSLRRVQDASDYLDNRLAASVEEMPDPARLKDKPYATRIHRWTNLRELSRATSSV